MKRIDSNHCWEVVVKPVGTPEQGQAAQQRALRIIAEWIRRNEVQHENGRPKDGKSRDSKSRDSF